MPTIAITGAVLGLREKPYTDRENGQQKTSRRLFLWDPETNEPIELAVSEATKNSGALNTLHEGGIYTFNCSVYGRDNRATFTLDSVRSHDGEFFSLTGEAPKAKSAA